MTDQNAQFEALRALLVRPPGAKVWGALCEQLAAWPAGDSKEMALAYAHSHLEHWDDRLRQGPIELWWPTFPKGTPRPEWSLVRALRLDEPHIYMRPKDSEPPAPEATQHITSFQLAPHNTEIAAYIAFVEGLGLPSLQALHIENHQYGEVELQVLLERPWFSSLSRLDLSYNKIGEAAIHALLGALSESQLTWLNLRANRLDSGALDALIDSPLFANLVHLDLGFNYELEASALDRMLATLAPGQLQTLRLDGLNVLGVDLAPVVTTHPALAGLTTLALSRCQLGDAGARALAASPYLEALTSLDISRNQIGPAGAQALGQSRFLQQLTTLELSHNPIGSLGLQAITGSPHLQQITQLHLKGIKF